MPAPPAGLTPQMILRQLRIIWGAFLVATVLYWVVLTLVTQGRTPTAGGADLLHTMLAVFSLFGVVGTVFIRQKFLGSQDVPPAGRMTYYIMAWGFAESAALMGLVRGLVTSAVSGFETFWIVTVVLLLWCRPQPQHFASDRSSIA